MKYALIKDNVVANVIISDADHAESISSLWDYVIPVEGAGIGWIYKDGFLIPPVDGDGHAVMFPRVVITSAQVDSEHAALSVVSHDFSTIKLPVGAVVTITAELQHEGLRINGFDAEFAMPMRSTDGAIRHLDVRFVGGVATFSAVMSDSKRWEVTQELVNSELSPDSHMEFDGIVITAVE